MMTYDEEVALQGVAKRFVQATEELRISGARLFRDGIVKNEQVLSKIKNGYQKLPKNSIQLFCKKYGVSAAWLYTGDGNMLLNKGVAIEKQQKEVREEKLLYNTDFESCLDRTVSLYHVAMRFLFPSPWQATSILCASTTAIHWHQSSCRVILLH